MSMNMSWHGDQAKAARRQGTARGLGMAAEHVLAKSREVVPLEEATLSRSGTASVDEAGEVAAVSFDTPYAARQHEELTWRHAPGRTAKYLERPLGETRPDQARLIARGIQDELK